MMSEITEIFYKVVSFGPNLMAAMECEPVDDPHCAEVSIPYHDPDGRIYGMTCYLMQVPANTPAIAAIMLLMQCGQLLARRGGRDEQFENVVSAYQYGAKPEDETQCFMQFDRPQDFAVRGLDGDCPKWEWRLINYIVTEDHQDQRYTMKAGTSFICNAWSDVEMDDAKWFTLFGSVYPMMSMKTSGPPPTMRPTDCMGIDDWWDDRLGTPPADCPEENDYE